jgi:hypothetical protein
VAPELYRQAAPDWSLALAVPAQILIFMSEFKKKQKSVLPIKEFISHTHRIM